MVYAAEGYNNNSNNKKKNSKLYFLYSILYICGEIQQIEYIF